jgi:hypothetical protein
MVTDAIALIIIRGLASSRGSASRRDSSGILEGNGLAAAKSSACLQEYILPE